MADRYHVGETSGYLYETTSYWEHEFSVYDEAYCCEPVGTFIARGNRGGVHMPRNEERAAERAQRMCDALNRRERGVAYDPNALFPNYGVFPPRGRKPNR